MTKIQVPIVVGIIKNDKGEILISKRRDTVTPDADGKWEFVGGRIEFGETPEQAIIREAREESGLETEVVRLLPEVPTNHWNKTDGSEWQVILIYYELRPIGGQLHLPDKFDEKITELKFIKPDEINNYDTLPEIKHMLSVLLNTTH